MALFLLDSDALIDFVNGFEPTISLLRSLLADGETLCSCGVALTEAYAGLNPEGEAPAAAFLPTLRYLPTSSATAEQAGRWRYRAAREGRTLTTTDTLIAATAVAHNATVVTGNVRDFPMSEVSLLPLPR
jgi:predicted nucleic acid-binding protein